MNYKCMQVIIIRILEILNLQYKHKYVMNCAIFKYEFSLVQNDVSLINSWNISFQFIPA